MFLIYFRNGPTAASPLIGSYCGSNIPKTIPSHTNKMFLRFRSDMSKTGTGFLLYYESTTTGMKISFLVR